MTQYLRDVKARATSTLEQAGIDTSEADVITLLAHVLDVTKGNLVLIDELSDEEAGQFDHLVQQRAQRIPLQHLTGIAGFCELDLQVGSGVFVPRPETETLVQLARQFLHESAGEQPVVVDLCTGSAAIPLAIATSASVQAFGLELSEAAFDWAQRNVDAYGQLLAERDSTVELLNVDATTAISALPQLMGAVNVVTTNPPYIPDGAIPRDPEVRDHDPAMALYGGADGLTIMRELIGQAHELLVDGGVLLIEHGDEQADSVRQAIADQGGFVQLTDHPDLAGRPRVARAVRAYSDQ